MLERLLPGNSSPRSEKPRSRPPPPPEFPAVFVTKPDRLACMHAYMRRLRTAPLSLGLMVVYRLCPQCPLSRMLHHHSASVSDYCTYLISFRTERAYTVYADIVEKDEAILLAAHHFPPSIMLQTQLAQLLWRAIVLRCPKVTRGRERSHRRRARVELVRHQPCGNPP